MRKQELMSAHVEEMLKRVRGPGSGTVLPPAAVKMVPEVFETCCWSLVPKERKLQVGPEEHGPESIKNRSRGLTSLELSAAKFAPVIAPAATEAAGQVALVQAMSYE